MTSGCKGSHSVVSMLLEVVLQLIKMVSDRFALESENIAVLVEEEVVIIVAESVESYLVQ